MDGMKECPNEVSLQRFDEPDPDVKLFRGAGKDPDQWHDDRVADELMDAEEREND